MQTWRLACPLLLAAVAAPPAPAADGPAKRSAKEALQPFNPLIGSWKATGTPEARGERQNFWTEMVSWAWQFRGGDAWLNVTFDKGKYFASGELRYLADKDRYQLTLVTPAKESLVFEGELKDNRLTVQRVDEAKKETQQLVLTLLHENRFLYRYEVKPAERTLFARLYQVGATKEGVAFAGKGDGRPECVVSGGLGTIPVSYKGKTYYVCCSGCRDAFKDEPEKYIKEYEEKQAKEAKGR
jgi:hypothetical protein